MVIYIIMGDFEQNSKKEITEQKKKKNKVWAKNSIVSQGED